MADHDHGEDDLRLLEHMRKLAVADFDAQLNLNDIVGRDDGAIPKMHRELIAVALTTQCPYGIEAHALAALRRTARGRSRSSTRHGGAGLAGVRDAGRSGRRGTYGVA